jgi:hypothetical protein
MPKAQILSKYILRREFTNVYVRKKDLLEEHPLFAAPFESSGRSNPRSLYPCPLTPAKPFKLTGDRPQSF